MLQIHGYHSHISFSGWLSVVRVYLQVGQGFIQQVASLHIMDSHNVRVIQLFISIYSGMPSLGLMRWLTVTDY